MKPMPDTTARSSEVVAFKDTTPVETHAETAVALRRSGPLSGLQRRLRGMGPLFWLTVVVPTVLATLYFGFLASDVYVSESRYVVRSPEKPQKGGLGLLLGSAFRFALYRWWVFHPARTPVAPGEAA